MKLSICFLAICVLSLWTSEICAETQAIVFPPAHCSGSEQRLITWQDGGASTMCISGQEALLLALPNCRNGEHIVFRGSFHNRPVVDGQDFNQQTGYFVCEPQAPGFGGIYTVNLDGQCRHGNAMANDTCSCPASYRPAVFHDWAPANHECLDGAYSDGTRTSNCGIMEYYCVPSAP